jgi:hypothetical protein
LPEVADQLPTLVDQQRHAAIKQILDGLASERTNLVATLAADEIKLHANLVEIRTSLSNGTEFAKASDAMIKTLDSFIGRFDKGHKSAQRSSRPEETSVRYSRLRNGGERNYPHDEGIEHRPQWVG